LKFICCELFWLLIYCLIVIVKLKIAYKLELYLMAKEVKLKLIVLLKPFCRIFVYNFVRIYIE
jgi:hypothetical protein